MSSAGFELVLLGFTGFYWVLLCFTELGISSTGFDRVLLGFTGFNWDFLG